MEMDVILMAILLLTEQQLVVILVSVGLTVEELELDLVNTNMVCLNYVHKMSLQDFMLFYL